MDHVILKRSHKLPCLVRDRKEDSQEQCYLNTEDVSKATVHIVYEFPCITQPGLKLTRHLLAEELKT